MDVAVPTEGLLDARERRLHRIHPLLLLGTVYKHFWNTIGLLLLLAPFVVLILVFVFDLGAGRRRIVDGDAFAMSMGLGLGIIVLLIVIAFFFDLATRTFSIAGGILWLLLALVSVVQMLRAFQYFAGAAEVAGTMTEKSPWFGGLVAASIVVAFGIAIHYAWVIARGAFALLLIPNAERQAMREAPAGTSFASRFLVGFWSLPPTFEFARRLRFAAIFPLAILGSLFVSLAGMVLLILIFPIYNQAGWLGAVANARGLLPEQILPALLIYGGVFAALLILGGGARLLMRLLVRTSLDTLQANDTRAPILFLRAFGDDQVPLKPPRMALLAKMLEVGQRRTSLDRLLLDQATGYGPVVGLGNPDDKRPPYGVARGYFADDKWQSAVAGLMRDSSAIVICVDDTDGIWWEVERIAGERHLEKTLFLLHPKHRTAEDNARLATRLAHILGLPPDAASRLAPIPPTRGRGRPATLIGFYLGQSGLRCLHSSTFSRFAYLIAIREYLRVRFAAAFVAGPAASTKAELAAPTARPVAAPPPVAPSPAYAALSSTATILTGAAAAGAVPLSTPSIIAPVTAAAEPGRARRWLSPTLQLLAIAGVLALLYFSLRSPSETTTAKPEASFRDCPRCPEMVAIPAGEFEMGSPPGDPQARSSEFPQRRVAIAKRFAIGKFELTYDDWDACADDGACNRWSGNFGRGRHPVAGLPAGFIVPYLEWLSRKTGKTYRLPTEAEWEYAARAGTKTRYSWGDEAGTKRAHCSECESQSGWATMRVGQFPPNAFGLHDMHGNVAEFVADCWHPDFRGAPTDGRVWSHGGDCTQRTLRGGGHQDKAIDTRAASRAPVRFDHGNWNMGFRIARDLD